MLTYFGVGVFLAIVAIVLFAFKERGYDIGIFEEFEVNDPCDLGSLALLLIILWPAVIILGLAFYATGMVMISAGDFIEWLLNQIEKLIKGKNNNNSNDNNIS